MHTPRLSLFTAMVPLVLTLAWLSYTPSFSGSLHFDDRPNLQDLLEAGSTLDTLYEVFNGAAGPLGRPISLASFAIQQSSWPDNIAALFQTNVALHLVAGIAVFLLALGLARILLKDNRAPWVAVITFALWTLSPYLASSSLMLVQRMTILSGIFVFSGLAAYVWGRLLYCQRPTTGLLLMGLGIAAGTLLAAFSKESGALLPLLALVLEITLIRKNTSRPDKAVRALQFLIIVLPVLFLALYLALRIPGLLYSEGHRPFSPMDRFASQPALLFDYLRHLLIPNTASVTPFTDDWLPVSGWADHMAWLSILAWASIVTFAVILRKRLPILLFAVCFFLAGHMLESTIVYLELYFPHRNYVPSFGIYFAIAWTFVILAQSWPRVVIPGTIAYVSAFAVVLASTASLWGNPLVAAEFWGAQQPNSQRAQQFLANEYFQIGDGITAHRILERASSMDKSGALIIQELYTCPIYGAANATTTEQIDLAASRILEGERSNSMGAIILALTVKVVDDQCDSLDVGQIETLIEAVLSSPNYRDSWQIKVPIYNAKALLAQGRGDLAGATDFVLKMYNNSRHPNHARVYAGLLVSQGRTEEARSFINEAKGDAPKHLVKRWVRKRQLNELLISLDAHQVGDPQ